MSIRVLVVDDSLVIRKVLCDELGREPNITTASAQDGIAALEKVTTFNPHVMVLDLEMPNLDGFGVLRELRKRNSRLPVVVFSTLSDRGARATLDALALGASDYLSKPTGGGIDKSRELLRDLLVPKVVALATRRSSDSATESGRKAIAGPTAQPMLAAPSQAPVGLIVIGISTGGPVALAQVIPFLPANFSVPLLIVQHMPATFTKMMAERLSSTGKLKVQEATGGEVIKPGVVLLAPGDQHMTLAADAHGQLRTVLDKNAPENGCRPSVDVLLRSAARHYGSHLLTIIMTGLGADGTKGCGAAVAGGGSVWVQDEASSVVWGMPSAVLRAGHACRVLPLDAIAAELTKVHESTLRGGLPTHRRTP
ncbi:MAG: chemotaxis-specific protein-glutamate methyltransferase CheB [Deltaproteobacteria bacterium]|nr:chemotaxis-specific protein-glutamate methyltransferase CheB [Deltaproteobacteria bacterium]